MNLRLLIKCPYTDKPCFARTADKKCEILKHVNPTEKCAFQKERRLETNGIIYPHDLVYVDELNGR